MSGRFRWQGFVVGGVFFAVFQTKQVFGKLLPGVVLITGIRGARGTAHTGKLVASLSICKRSTTSEIIAPTRRRQSSHRGACAETRSICAALRRTRAWLRIPRSIPGDRLQN